MPQSENILCDQHLFAIFKKYFYRGCTLGLLASLIKVVWDSMVSCSIINNPSQLICGLKLATICKSKGRFSF